MIADLVLTALAATASFFVLLLPAACDFKSAPKAPPPLPAQKTPPNTEYQRVTTTDELEGIDMVLEHSEGFLPLPGTTLRLGVKDRQLLLNAGCNAMFGKYTVVTDGNLVTDTLGTTEKSCPPGLGTQETWFRNFISSWPHIERSGPRLRLSNQEARLVFLDRKHSEPDQPLVGKPWKVNTLLDGEYARHLALTRPPSLTFRADQSLELFTGCNTGRGKYTVHGSTLQLSNLSFTKMACSGNEGDADKLVKAVLVNGAVGFSIDQRTLELERGSAGLGAVR